MEIEVEGGWDTSTSKVGLTTRGDRSIEIHYGVVVSRAVIFASSGEGRVGRESMALEWVVRVNPGSFVGSSGEGSLQFRCSWLGNCQSEDPVVSRVSRGPKQRRRWARCGSDGNSRSTGGEHSQSAEAGNS